MLKKKLAIAVVVLFLSVSIYSCTSAKTTNLANTIYVDDDNTEGPWDGSIEHPFQKIQDGVNVSDEGDTVFVYSGTYYENLAINKSIVLIGESKYTTIVDGSNIWHCVTISAPNGATVKNFTFQNGRFGVLIGYYNATSKNNAISDNIIKNNNGGISISASENDLISNNIIYNNIYEGLMLWSSSHNIKIVGNTISHNGDDGILVLSSNNVIKENEIFNNDGDGIYFAFCNANSITRNKIYGNNRHGIAAYAVMRKLSDYTFEWNNISDNYYCGIYLIGVPALNIKITHNHFENNGANGVEIRFTFFSQISQNNFIDNAQNAFYIVSGLNVWSRNYWDEPRYQPYPIYGIIPTNFIDIPLVQFDWLPAKEPYDVSIPYV